MGSQSRPAILKATKRVVRKRCGFGCVICGSPLYEYDHMQDWASTRSHDEANLTILCDSHHREKTAGLLPLSAVIAANDRPFNIREGQSSAYHLHYSGSLAEIVIGGNKFSGSPFRDGWHMTAIAIDRSPMVAFSFQDGCLLLTLQAFNSSGERAIWIDENELVYAISAWDIELVGSRLVLRDLGNRFLIDLTFEPPSRITINRGCLVYERHCLLASSSSLSYMNRRTSFSGCSFRGPGTAIAAGIPPEFGCALHLPPAEGDTLDFSYLDAWLAKNEKGTPPVSRYRNVWGERPYPPPESD